MKILIISDEVWNDQIHGNNILTNLFEGFDAELANIYCSPGEPYNNCCKNYFQITDSMMLKSIIGGPKAGTAFNMDYNDKEKYYGEKENKKLYSVLKILSTESLRAIRELIWYCGKYNTDALQQFIQTFDPDIIFSPRFASIKLLRLEKIVFDIAKVPIVAFTGDAEYSMKLLKTSPVFWIKKLIMRHEFRKMMPHYSLYYTLSDEQKNEYQAEFGNKFKILRKCGDFNGNNYRHQLVNAPIKIVYAGKLYSNRWKTLAEISKALRIVNDTMPKMILEIYTKDKINKKQLRLLDDGRNSFIKNPVSQEELKIIYGRADIALHVESFDLRDRLLTRVSFSTKIIDCLSSGCAVMVTSWDKHSGYTYLKKEDAALTVNNKNDILPVLIKISQNPQLINEYAQKAWLCGQRNHQKEDVQKMLHDDFNKIIKKGSR